MNKKIEYNIKLNDENKIDINVLSMDDDISDKYFLINVLKDLLSRSNSLHNNKEIDDVINTLNLLSNNIKPFLIKNLKKVGYSDLQVNNLNDLYKLKHTTIRNGNIIKRKIGLKVYVISEDTIYELVDGVDNKNWKPIK